MKTLLKFSDSDRVFQYHDEAKIVADAIRYCPIQGWLFVDYANNFLNPAMQFVSVSVKSKAFDMLKKCGYTVKKMNCTRNEYLTRT